MGFSLPNQFIKEKDKDKEWYKSHLDRIVTAVGSRSGYQSTRDYMNFNNYNGLIDNSKVKGKIAPLGIKSPTKYVRYGLTRAMVSTLYNEFISMSLDQKASSINHDAIVRKDKFKLDLITNKLLDSYNKEISEQLGFDITTEQPDLPTPDDIDKYMKMEHREVQEEVIDGITEYVLIVKNKREQINYAFLNFLITSKAFFKVEEESGDPSLRQIDPRLAIYEYPFGTDFLDDVEVMGEEQFLTLSQVIHRYHNCECEVDKRLTKDEVLELAESITNLETHGQIEPVGLGEYVPLRLSESNTPEISAVSVQWRGKKIFKYKESQSKKQKELIYRKTVGEKYKAKKNEKVREYLFDELYKGTLLAGKYLVDWGVSEDQVRSIDAPEKVELDYDGLIQGATNNTSLSLVEKLTPFDEMDSDLFYSIRQALNRAGGKSIVYDLALLPTEMFGSPEKAMKKVAYHLKENNVIWINTRKGGVSKSSFNQFKDVDFGISNTVSSLVNLKAMNMEAAIFASGISPQRQGDVGQYATDGTTDRSIEQSMIRTREYFQPFNRLVSRVLGKMANKAKFIYPAGKKLAYIAGDSGAKVFDILPNLPLSDYGFFIGDTVKDKQLKNKIEQVSTQILQGAQDPRLILEVFKVMKADSAAEAEAIFEKGVEAMEKMNEQRSQQEAAAQQEAAKIQQETEAIKERNADKERLNKLEVANIKALNAIDVATIQTESKETIEKAKQMKDLYQQKIDIAKQEIEQAEGGGQQPSPEEQEQMMNGGVSQEQEPGVM